MNPNEENCSGWTAVTKKRSNKKAVQHTKGKMNIDVKKKPPIIKATQPFVTKETMMIEPAMMGLVAGRKGSNLKRLKEIYEVNISLPPKGGSQIILEGPAKMVSAVKKDIEENLSCNTSSPIEKDHTWLLIGPDGEKLQALQDEHNVRIEIRKEGKVEVTGTRCEEAKKAIEEKLSSVTSFFIENDYRYLVIGQEGETIRDLKKVHNVEIHINVEGKVSIVGKEGEEAKKAIESVIERFKIANPFKEKFSVPESTASFLWGENSSNLKRIIESTYKVLVFILRSKDAEPQILVMGTVAENVSAAKKDILENLEGMMSLDIDENLAERIVGLGGDAARCLEKEFDVSIHNLKESKGENLHIGEEGSN